MLPPAKTDMPLKGDTVIENDVWIGQNAVILPGVYIGNGAIIGANSVVGSDVAPYAPRLSAPLTLITQHLQGAEKHLAASLLPHLLVYFWVFSSSSSRSVIFRRLMPRVDPLCSNAEVVGGSTPATPSAISARLKPTMKR